MTRLRAEDWALLAWTLTILTFTGVVMVQDTERRKEEMKRMTMEVLTREEGAEAYYPARDTSFLRYICCGVIPR